MYLSILYLRIKICCNINIVIFSKLYLCGIEHNNFYFNHFFIVISIINFCNIETLARWKLFNYSLLYTNIVIIFTTYIILT